ncbi:Serine/threonine-protein phosphatase 4 regulatory subunit 3 [Meyerozyma sp. JA9]|nr:Serine/threonine-protein phosphatase 4 regulatory subunit 3 [Meyerozyma sp. JA9]
MSKPRRVKVYLLEGDDWLDHGTGYCVGEMEEETKKAYFTVRNEVDSEDIILKSCLEGNIQYQRQQETLIVWTDGSGKDLALSFQETEGCADLCEFIIHAQQENYSPQISLYYVIPNVESTSTCDVTELITGPIAYPPDPTRTNLDECLEAIIRGSSSQFSRSKITEYVKEKNYLVLLINLMASIEAEMDESGSSAANEPVTEQPASNDSQPSNVSTTLTSTSDTSKTSTDTETTEPAAGSAIEPPVAQSTSNSNSENTTMAEQMPPFKSLVLIAEIIKTLILYNEAGLIEDFTSSEEKIYGLSGILEYDSDPKADYRGFLSDKTKLQMVIDVPCSDAQLGLFKRDFYLNFLRDVALQRCIDDQAFNILSSIIYLNQVEIVQFLVDSDSFLPKLFESYEDPSSDGETRRNGVKMLHQYVMIAKSLQTHQKLDFFSALVKSGLFSMIKFALEDVDINIRILGTELIVIIIEQDVCLVSSIDKEEAIDLSDPPSNEFVEEKIAGVEDHTRLKLADDMTLIHILIRLLLNDKNAGLKLQALEALKMLLDTNIADSDSFNGTTNGENNQYVGSRAIQKADKANGEAVFSRLASNGTRSPPYNGSINTANYFSAFYSKAAPELFGPVIDLNDKPDAFVVNIVKLDELLYQHLCDLMSFCWCEHEKAASADFFLGNNVINGVARLIGAPVKITVRVAALRCLKSLLLTNEVVLFRHVLRNNILDNYFEFFKSVAHKNNLANSTCLSFLDTIHKQCDRRYNAHDRSGYRSLAVYIVEKYEEFILSLSYFEPGKDLVKATRKGTENGFVDTSEPQTEPTVDSDVENLPTDNNCQYATHSSPPETVQTSMFQHIETDMRCAQIDKRGREAEDKEEIPTKERKLSISESVAVGSGTST